MAKHIVMSIPELLIWAHDETKLADALETSMSEFGVMIGLDLDASIARHRERSRWLDEQVAFKLDEIERNEKS